MTKDQNNSINCNSDFCRKNLNIRDGIELINVKDSKIEIKSFCEISDFLEDFDSCQDLSEEKKINCFKRKASEHKIKTGRNQNLKNKNCFQYFDGKKFSWSDSCKI